MNLTNRLFQYCCALMILAILYSKALITILYGMIILLAVVRIYHCTTQFMFHWRHNKYLLLYGLIFLAIPLSGGSVDIIGQWEAMWLKLPFLLMPIAFMAFRFTADFVVRLHVWLIAVLTLSTLPVLIYSVTNQAAMIELISRGQAIPTPIEHVKYSIFLAYGACTAIALYFIRNMKIDRPVRMIMGLCGLWLVVMLHYLSVRTGLVIMYVGVFILVLRHFYQVRQLRYLLVYIPVVIFMAFLAIRYIPTLHAKWSYMNYDHLMYRTGSGQQYSDSERLRSWQIGADLFCQSPIYGVGMAHIEEKCKTSYQKQGYEDYYRKPHNQFLYVAVGGGVVGLLFFIIGFYGPLYFSTPGTSIFTQLLYLSYSLSFLVENSVERSMSIAFFLLLALVSLQTNSTNEES